MTVDVFDITIYSNVNIGPPGISGIQGSQGPQGLTGAQGFPGVPGSGGSEIKSGQRYLELPSADLGGGSHGATDFFTDTELILSQTSTVYVYAKWGITAAVPFNAILGLNIPSSLLAAPDTFINSKAHPTNGSYLSPAFVVGVVTLVAGTYNFRSTLSYNSTVSTTVYSNMTLVFIVGENTGVNTFTAMSSG